MDIKVVTASDVNAIAELFDTYRVFYNQASDVEAAKAFIGARIEEKQSIIFAAQEEGQFVGFTQLYPSFSSVKKAYIFTSNGARHLNNSENSLQFYKHTKNTFI